MSREFISSREASKQLGISRQTLRKYADEGKIQVWRDPNSTMSHRRYNISEFINRNKNIGDSNIKRKRLVYCRVSTRGQQDDLERQIQYMRDRFPDHQIIRDIGSGLNFKRQGLKTILEQASNGEVEELVVAHKDRLARFGFELIEYFLQKFSQAKIVVLEQNEGSPEQELVQDVLSILNVFSAKANGLRKYKVQISNDYKNKENKNETQPASEKDID